MRSSEQHVCFGIGKKKTETFESLEAVGAVVWGSGRSPVKVFLAGEPWIPVPCSNWTQRREGRYPITCGQSGSLRQRDQDIFLFLRTEICARPWTSPCTSAAGIAFVELSHLSTWGSHPVASAGTDSVLTSLIDSLGAPQPCRYPDGGRGMKTR